jgi:hypothetical protein
MLSSDIVQPKKYHMIARVFGKLCKMTILQEFATDTEYNGLLQQAITLLNVSKLIQCVACLHS